MRRTNGMLGSIFAIGVLMRLLLFVYNRVENSYDNHLEPILYYVEHQQRPAPDACWQCYQPPLYYVVAASVYEGALRVTKSTYRAGKAVQGINTVLSVATLALIILLIKKRFPNQPLLVMVLAAVAAVLPRDIYASAIISNDYLLVFLTTCSVWVYLRHVARPATGSLVGLCVLAATSALTKQHGLLVLLLPGSILLRRALQRSPFQGRPLLQPAVLLSLLILGLGLSDELWKYQQTQVLLVSNQHFFPMTDKQPPGSVRLLDLHSFRLPALLRHPALSEATNSSYWTVLFANTWFDYELLFVKPQFSRAFAGIPYVYGVGLLCCFIWGALHALTNRRLRSLPWATVTLACVAGCFFLVPLLQTLRLPYFSSMKSQFILPASCVWVLLLGYALREIKLLRVPAVAYSVVALTVGIGFGHVVYLVTHLRWLP
ncbi:hypothetical protein [Hymenobacter terrenus]|uniref:hypothetical protein n=1 Tax=Hymenobacter terrenus TaxID=1629124 RepID=UPI0018CEA726|nr:hypothetical protein [Hymenobacter terrenus]